jgi:DNA-binding IclR family transcriptional regulator
LALRALADLVAVTGHTGYLGILSGTEVVVLASEDGVHRVRLKVNPGERFPAYATAIGKALLARLPVQQVTDLYSGVAFAPITDRTLTSLRALLADLKRTRRRRYAWADQETFAGIRAAGVACVSPADSESFAMSISYPTPSVTRRDEERIIEALVGTGERLGRALGDPWWMTEAPPV